MNVSSDALRHTATAALVAFSALGGWLAHGLLNPPPVHTSGPPPAAPLPAVHRAVTPSATLQQPVIVIASDGRATLHVDQQPLAWVLEQIAQRSGWHDVHARAAAVAASGAAPQASSADGSESSCTDPAITPPADLRRTLQAIESGSEAERFEGLLQARGDAMTLQSATLRTLAETDGSERVRLLALEAWLEQQADRPEALRSALESALLMPGASLQAEARRRLDELRASDSVDAGDPQPLAAP